MATARPENATAKHVGWSSIANSLLLPATAALQFNVTFWVLVTTNFFLMHAVWIIQLVRFRNWAKVDFSLVKWPLFAFAALGNLALLLWG